jgi:hypothetical protein
MLVNLAKGRLVATSHFLILRLATDEPANGAPVGPSITPIARRDTGRVTPCVRAGTSKNRENTEFATILEMGQREAYPGRDPAVLAHGALEDTPT